MKANIEILSPAGSYESLKAAIAAGADAVYIGGSRFGARAFANNLQEEQLLEAIDYVHLHGKKIYLTINTLLKEQELKNELYDYLLPYYKQGLDAVIVQDIGVLQFVREQFPDLPIHASTQMTVTNLLGAKLLEKQGVERVVTSREMHLKEIEEISKYTSLEIESFVHGALCYCYSGQCLYSSMLGGRSGNRGQCAQPCRLPYRVNGAKETQYILSLKDMCTLEYIPELIEAGIHSFKIEGRMKKPEYVALVTAMYRKYTDMYLEKGKTGFRVEPKDREMLMDLYNRGGSHGGYYYTRNGREMLSLTRPNHAGVPALKITQQSGKQVSGKALVDMHKGDVIELPDGIENYTFANDVKKGQTVKLVTHKKQAVSAGQILNRTRNEQLLTRVKETIVERKVKELVKGELYLSTTSPSVLTLSCQTVKIQVTGECAQEAVNQPMDQGRIEKQLRKTGNTPFEFEELQIKIDGNIFVPMQALNELRRTGLEKLEAEILSIYRRSEPERKPVYAEEKKEAETTMFCAYVETKEQLKEVLDTDFVESIYVDCNMIKQVWRNNEIRLIIDDVHGAGKKVYLAMPHIFRKDTIQKYLQNYTHIFESGWDGVLVRNYESYLFLREQNYQGEILTDHNLYQFNQYAKRFWRQEGAVRSTAPLELNYRELKEVGVRDSELIIYGYAPMMVSAQCIQKTTSECRKEQGVLRFKDRYQKEFTAKNQCDYCYNVIYNAAPMILTDQRREIEELQPKALRMNFTIESAKQVRSMLKLYREVFYMKQSEREADIEFTRGHFKRGIK